MQTEFDAFLAEALKWRRMSPSEREAFRASIIAPPGWFEKLNSWWWSQRLNVSLAREWERRYGKP